MQNLAEILCPKEYKMIGWCVEYNKPKNNFFVTKIKNKLKYKLHLLKYKNILKTYSFRVNDNFSCSNIAKFIKLFNLMYLKKSHSYKIVQNTKTMYVDPIRAITIDSKGNFCYSRISFTFEYLFYHSFFTFEYNILSNCSQNFELNAKTTSIEIFHKLESMHVLGVENVI